MVGAVHNNFGMAYSRIQVVSRGVDLGLFRPLPLEARLRHRADYGVSAQRFVLLSPRYLLNSVYNIDVVLRAVAKVKDAFPEMLLVQMHNHPASDPSLLKTSALIDELGIRKNVLLLPSVENNRMPELYAISDLCISVPSSDGFPVTVLEASACKVPLIVSRLAYTSEWFRDGENGLVIEQGDAAALASAIVDLRVNPDKRGHLAENGIRKVAAEADKDRCMRSIAAVYQEVRRR
jgi:glycosyltransferase involved in cell wall biosynthesis